MAKTQFRPLPADAMPGQSCPICKETGEESTLSVESGAKNMEYVQCSRYPDWHWRYLGQLASANRPS